MRGKSLKSLWMVAAFVALGVPVQASAVATDVHVVNTSSDPVLSSIVGPIDLARGTQVGISPDMNTVSLSSTGNTVRFAPGQTLRVQAAAVPFSRGTYFNLAAGANKCTSLS